MYLGAFLLVCTLLEGRVKPTSRFKNCTFGVEDKQEVMFDIPLSAGVVSSTFGMKHKDSVLPTLIRGKWSLNQNYEYPVIMGVDDDAEELKEWANQVELEVSTRQFEGSCGERREKASTWKLLLRFIKANRK